VTLNSETTSCLDDATANPALAGHNFARRVNRVAIYGEADIPKSTSASGFRARGGSVRREARPDTEFLARQRTAVVDSLLASSLSRSGCPRVTGTDAHK
jgi:hypothetical protein